jgi:RNA polymerase sigma factor (sigma-70 family)
MNGRGQATDGPGTPTRAVLFRQAQAGCRDSLARLMAAHDGLVHAVVRQQVLGHLPFAEAVQAGRIGLWRAILHFDPQRGTAFSTYAWTCIMHRVWREVKLAERAQGQTGQYLPLGEAATRMGEDGDPAHTWAARVVYGALWDLIAHLPERLRIVVLARYELTGQPQIFYSEIGAGLGVSGERARQLHTEALIWLRQPARTLLGCHTLADYETVEAETQRWLQWRGGRHG